MYVSRRPWAVAILDAVWEDLRRPLGESLYYDVLMVQVRASLPPSLCLSRSQCLSRSVPHSVSLSLTVYPALTRSPGAPPQGELRKLIANLKRWTAPERVGAISLLTFPSHQWVEKEPYGRPPLYYVIQVVPSQLWSRPWNRSTVPS